MIFTYDNTYYKRDTNKSSLISDITFYWLHFAVLEMKIWIYWSESNSWIYFYILLNKNWKIYWSWARGLVLIMRNALTNLWQTYFSLNRLIITSHISGFAFNTIQQYYSIIIDVFRKIKMIFWLLNEGSVCYFTIHH